METKAHLLTADKYKISRGIGLKHGDPTISVRIPVDKKKELEEMIDRLVALGRTEGKQDFLRELIYKAMEENQAIAATTDTIVTPAEPTPKKTRGRKKSVS